MKKPTENDEITHDNPTDDEILIDDDVPLGENPNMGVEAPVGAGIAAAGAALALGAAALTKKRKK